jgi:hypothetical protein
MDSTGNPDMGGTLPPKVGSPVVTVTVVGIVVDAVSVDVNELVVVCEIDIVELTVVRGTVVVDVWVLVKVKGPEVEVVVQLKV